MHKFKISIIIPIYKVEEYIEDCLNSVLEQIPNCVEIICVNDGTPDNSAIIAKNIVSKCHEKVQKQFVFINQENSGLSEARNKGIAFASGEYIGFLDSDDKLQPEYFKILLKALSNNSYDVIDFNLMTSEGKLIQTRSESFDSIFTMFNWFCPARIFNKKIFEKYTFTKDIFYEDLDLIPEIYINYPSTLHINQPLYWYRTNPDGITMSSNLKNIIKTENSISKILQKYHSLYINSSNPYYAFITVYTIFLLCTTICKKVGLKESLSLLKKYHTILSSINIYKLGLDMEPVSKKFIAFYKSPIAYLILYSLYIKLN